MVNAAYWMINSWLNNSESWLIIVIQPANHGYQLIINNSCLGIITDSQ